MYYMSLGRPIRPNKTMPLPGLGVGVLLESPKYGDRWCVISRASAPIVLDGGPRWTLKKSGRCFYAGRNTKNGYQEMHAVVAGTPKGMDTRHLNGDGLDNRRCNVTAGTRRENTQERWTHREGRLPGTTQDKRDGAWVAQIRRRGSRARYLGRFPTEQAAHEAYLRAVAELPQ